MGLSNAERQRRYVSRLKARAEAPHSPDLILEALARLKPMHFPKGGALDRFAERLRAEANRLCPVTNDAREIRRAVSNGKRLTPKSEQRNVTLFGRQFWPINNSMHPDLAYDYETLVRAVWTFRELHTVCRNSSDGSPKSCAIRIRHIIKFLNGGYLDSKVMFLIIDMTRALEKNPDGEERLPDMPNLDKRH